jgi:hypothetical protein
MFHSFVATIILLAILTTGGYAAPATGTEYLKQLVSDVTPANARGKIVQLAAKVDRKEVTVGEFADLYFGGKGAGGEGRKKWVRNMTRNFRIISSRKQIYSPQQKILAMRSVEVTLLAMHQRGIRNDGPAVTTPPAP